MSNSDQVPAIVGLIDTDGAFRTLFFGDVTHALDEYALDPMARETLRQLSNCPVTRLSSAMIDNFHSKYAEKARNMATAV